MKVLQINAVYGIGSTGRIVQDISRKLVEQGHEAYACWAISCREQDAGVKLMRIGNTLDHKVHALLRRVDGRQGWHSKVATRKACKAILEIAPDVVHLHNLHSNYIHLPTLLSFLGEHNVPTLITLHDCWMYTAGCCTYYHHYHCDEWMRQCANCPARGQLNRNIVSVLFDKKLQLYLRMRNLHVNGVSMWTTKAASYSMLSSAKSIQCIYNWIDTSVFKPQENVLFVRKRLKIPENHKLILGVSQGWSKEKGLDEFIRLAEELKDCATIILVGEKNGVPEAENLRCIGFTSNRQELVELYSAADVLVNPSKAETFGLVTVEAMACGTPVVAYNNSGAAELVAPQCGILVSDGNVEELIFQTKILLREQKEKYTKECRQWVCGHFEKKEQVQKYIDLYSRMITE